MRYYLEYSVFIHVCSDECFIGYKVCLCVFRKVVRGVEAYELTACYVVNCLVCSIRIVNAVQEITAAVILSLAIMCG